MPVMTDNGRCSVRCDACLREWDYFVSESLTDTIREASGCNWLFVYTSKWQVTCAKCQQAKVDGTNCNGGSKLIAFKTFSLRDKHKIVRKANSFFGGEYTYEEKVSIYADTDELYRAVAAFADSCGPNLVAITGTPFGETSETYTAGHVVVWYREERK